MKKRDEFIPPIDSHLTTGEVARILHVHPNTVRRWSKAGLIKTYRVGPRGDRRFKRTDVDTIIRENN